MTAAALAARLEWTYRHTLTALRPRMDGTEETLYTAVPCAMSRSAKVSAPAPAAFDTALPESVYRVSLYTHPEVLLRLGDRVEIGDGTGRIWRGGCADSVVYDSHAVTVVEIIEVVEGAGAVREAARTSRT